MKDKLKPGEIIVSGISMERVIYPPDDAGACQCEVCAPPLKEDATGFQKILKQVTFDDTKIRLWPTPKKSDE